MGESRGFAIEPAGFHDTVAEVLGNAGASPAELSASGARFRRLAAAIRALAAAA
ncbi:MAG: hypothetical protein ACREQI_09745 [Candidatus Binataceae bacterium]